MRFLTPQFLCLQYVDFQLAFPETDTQIPLGQAYAAAVKLYEGKREWGKG